MAQLDFKYVPNRQGGNNLAFNGYLFRVKTTRGDRAYWKCTVPACQATLNTKDNTITGLGQHHMDNKLLYNFQSGFRAAHSTDTFT